MIDCKTDEPLWVEKYRPRKIQDCILPDRLKRYFQSIVESGEIKSLLLVGGAGQGKTTVAKALCNELGIDCMVINASMSGNIDTLRTTILNFASTVSFTSKYKVVILDEADYLNCFAGNQCIKTVNLDNEIVYKPLSLLYDKTVDIMSYDFNTMSEVKTKGHVFQSGSAEVYMVKFDDNSRMYCTKDHPFYSEINNTEITIGIGNTFVATDNKLKKIVSMESIGFQPVFDVTTDNDCRNFILENGIIAHNCNSTQPALRNFMEEFSKNCRFIMTANFANRIIEPLKSRCAVIDFNFSKEERRQMIMPLDTRIKLILDNEGVSYDKNTLAKVIVKNFPDIRKILNELQRHASVGDSIDADIITSLSDDSIKTLFSYLRDASKWKDMRKWVVDNIDNSQTMLSKSIYDHAEEYVKPSSLPQLILSLAEWDYKSSFMADKELALAGMLTELMMQLEYK